MEEMKKEDLEKLHKAMLLIAREIDRICRLNHIQYSLCEGSLLGAVRHKGYIPWDDDMDILMLRPEYNKFVEACKSDLDSRFELLTNDTDSNYFYGFGKVILKDTIAIQKSLEKTKYKKGIFVDVFPFDNISDEKKLRNRQARINYLLMKMLARKEKVAIEDKRNIKKRIGFFLIDLVVPFFSTEYMIKKLNANMTQYKDVYTKSVCNIAGYWGYSKGTMKRRYFDEYIYVPFESIELSIIKSYDPYLKQMYGDYMKLPPVEKRHTHGFKKLDFGPYNHID